MDERPETSIVEEAKELDEIRSHVRLRRSRLDRFKAEILELIAAKVSYAGIALWLRTHCRVKASRSAIHSRVQHWKSSAFVASIVEQPLQKLDRRGKVIRQAGIRVE